MFISIKRSLSIKIQEIFRHVLCRPLFVIQKTKLKYNIPLSEITWKIDCETKKQNNFRKDKI